MKTPEEIKKGLECCISCTSCTECPYNNCGDQYGICAPVLINDAFDLVQQLEQELAAVKLINDATQFRADALEDALKHQKKQYAKLLETASILSDAVDELEKEGQSND